LNDEKPVHPVSVKPFFMGKYPIIQEQYQAVMKKKPSSFKGVRNPVEKVSWNDAVKFCEKLSQKTGRIYRLPSEAEWEYACCSGTQTKYCFGDDGERLKDYAWYDNNSERKTHQVGRKKPNAFGLYDMHGNVWEWCSDRWHNNYNNAPTDGSSWETGKDDIRVLRGGSWGSDATDCRSANRTRDYANYCFSLSGFRVVCIPALPKTL